MSIDCEAIAWALAKLDKFGVGYRHMDDALMIDRLRLMVQETTAPAPQTEESGSPKDLPSSLKGTDE